MCVSEECRVCATVLRVPVVCAGLWEQVSEKDPGVRSGMLLTLLLYLRVKGTE